LEEQAERPVAREREGREKKNERKGEF